MPIKEPNPNDKLRSDAIIKFLQSHPLINYNALCSFVGYEKDTLSKAFEGKRSIPERYLKEFEDVLSN